MAAYHWELMDEMSPEMRSAYSNFTALANEGEIVPKKYRELMVLGMACVLRSAPAVRTHAQIAVEKYGATKEEIFMVLATAMSLGGVPAYREACIALEEYMKTL